MALVKYGGGVVQMAGSIAGTVFARNRYGNYTRARTKPTNPNTAYQVEVRTAVAALVDRWSQTVTAGQRAAWGLYADSVAMKNRLGETMHLSGFNHYIRSNAMQQRLAKPLIDNGPVIFELPDHDQMFAVSASEATQQITFAYDDARAWNNEDNGFLWVFQGQPQNAQRNFFAGPWRRLYLIAGAAPAGPASPGVAPARFPIAEGQHQWIYARISRADGRLSEPFRADAYVGA